MGLAIASWHMPSVSLLALGPPHANGPQVSSSHRKLCSQLLGQQPVKSPRKLLFVGNFWLLTQKGFPVHGGCTELV